MSIISKSVFSKVNLCKKQIVILVIYFFVVSCQNSQNCIDKISIERVYDAPSPDLITISINIQNDLKDKISNNIFSHVNFYINKEEFFTTHDCVIEKTDSLTWFYIRTPYFNHKKDFTEDDFYKLIDESKDLKVELVYDKTKVKFTFKKCF